VPARNSRSSQDHHNELGPRIRELREAAGLSLEKLAVKLQKDGWDVGRVVLSNIELQRRLLTDVEIRKILKALGKSWRDL
jgi:transcriptional regulator with XRE-family HTH domain